MTGVGWEAGDFIFFVLLSVSESLRFLLSPVYLLALNTRLLFYQPTTTTNMPTTDARYELPRDLEGKSYPRILSY